MKVIFLDIDGVLNSDRTLYEYTSLEDDLILNLKEIVDCTGAKIILSSSWRTLFSPMAKLMDKFDRYGLHISGMTPNGVEKRFVEDKGYKPTNKYLDTKVIWDENDQRVRVQTTHDRGSEIMFWLEKHRNVESFVILDDEDFDIKEYYDKQFIKTSYSTGLTKQDVEKAINILNCVDKINNPVKINNEVNND